MKIEQSSITNKTDVFEFMFSSRKSVKGESGRMTCTNWAILSLPNPDKESFELSDSNVYGQRRGD